MRCFALAAALIAVSTGSPVLAQETVTLEEALARAGVGIEGEDDPSSNPRVYGPQAEAEAARAAIDQARLRPNPELSLEAENIAGSGAFSGLRSTEYTLAIGQPLELGGKRSARIASARASSDFAGLQSEFALSQLALGVRERYVQAVAAGQRLVLAREIVERNRELTRIANVLVEVGREPPLRAMRAQATLAEAEAELQAAQADDLAARQALAALWVSGQPNPAVSNVFPDLSPPLAPPVSENPLQLRIAGARTSFAEAEIARERSLGVPDPTLSAGVRRFEDDLPPRKWSILRVREPAIYGLKGAAEWHGRDTRQNRLSGCCVRPKFGSRKERRSARSAGRWGSRSRAIIAGDVSMAG